MRRYYCLLLVLAGLLAAQRVSAQHPSDPYATVVTTFAGDASLPVYSDIHVQYEITVWLTSAGSYDYQLSIADLDFDGTNCSGVNVTSLAEIVETVSDAAIVKGVTSVGYPSCGMTPYSKVVRIWTQMCGARSGSGCATAFAPCSGTSWYYRPYTIACPGNGNPAGITQGTASGDGCALSGCESTHPSALQ